MIFVDASAWFALSVTRDVNYVAATQWVRRNTELLLTTNYIVDETLTLLRARRQPEAALLLGRQFFEGEPPAQVHFLREEEIRAAWQVFQQFADKAWSFTDCSSKVVMEQLGIAQAFAFDHHFSQFGAVRTVP